VIEYLNGQDGAICPTWDMGFVPQGKFIMFWCFHIMNPLLTKLVWSRWLDVGLFLHVNFISVNKHAKKNLPGSQYPAILTSRLVNNPYI